MAKKKKRKITERQRIRRKLRSGSREAKRILLMQNPVCDICGRKGISLELHHVTLIRHGYPTKLENTVLLCQLHHKMFHSKFDRYLDRLHTQNPNTDWKKVYEELKKQLQTQLHILP